MTRRLHTMLLAMGLLASACGGNDAFDIGVQELSGDITYGDQTDEAPAPRPPGADLVPTTAPGLIAAPVRLDMPALAAPPPPPAAPSVPCPTAPSTATPETSAAPSVSRGPTAGVYTYRRTGHIKLGVLGQTDVKNVAPVPLSTEITRVVKNVNVTPVPESTPRITFDVEQQEAGLRTTTSYLIDPVGSVMPNNQTLADPGVRITRIVTERADIGQGERGQATGQYRPGVESFNPQPAIKIMDLPAAPQGRNYDQSKQYSYGVDPLTGAEMEVWFHNTGREFVDVCGTVVDAHKVNLWYPELPRFSRYNNGAGRQYTIAGTFWLAPQLGGLIIADDFTFGGQPGSYESGARPFEQRSAAVLNSVTPA